MDRITFRREMTDGIDKAFVVGGWPLKSTVTVDLVKALTPSTHIRVVGHYLVFAVENGTAIYTVTGCDERTASIALLSGSFEGVVTSALAPTSDKSSQETLELVTHTVLPAGDAASRIARAVQDAHDRRIIRTT